MVLDVFCRRSHTVQVKLEFVMINETNIDLFANRLPPFVWAMVANGNNLFLQDNGNMCAVKITKCNSVKHI